ncbi:MAG TPA: SDR family NAD(P)-dependent oxidoreductase, partial [Mucilaginibacter sp.]|nr:SDR family NAD(P)-dependent oxidoreductase [Mucilaginibacter sp.]
MNIIITGASSGVGFEAVLDLILSGEHKVIALARSQDKLLRLSEIARGLNPDCRLYPIAFDIVNNEYAGLLQFIAAEFDNRVDILVNNAGMLINKPFAELE